MVRPPNVHSHRPANPEMRWPIRQAIVRQRPGVERADRRVEVDHPVAGAERVRGRRLASAAHATTSRR